MLNSPNGQPKLPILSDILNMPSDSGSSLNLDNIQGDVLIGMKKKLQTFYFFEITDSSTFKKVLAQKLGPRISTTTQMLDVNQQPITAVNIAFSQNGLDTMGVVDSLGDSAFTSGQAANAQTLGDKGTSNWVPEFTGTSIHAVILLSSDTESNINSELDEIKSILDSSTAEKYRLDGAVRPGDQEGHEHFGYLDGISQPGIEGFTTNPVPGQTVIPAGMILLGENGDTITRPAWAKDGSFLAFRQLQQLVPEFNKFLTDNPIPVSGLTSDQGSALLGARMVGRWKSGAPVDLAPLFDDPQLGADANRNNDFTYAHQGEDIQSNQTRCPFSAHTRKTAPRGDFNPVNTQNHILRSGIPYGPEVTVQEAQSGMTTVERGLAFIAYQSNIGAGFQFIQQNWADNPDFMFGKNSTPGFDPIIGAAGGGPRNVSGLDPTDSTRSFTLVTDFVQSRGGEYFFVPSMSAISGKLAN